MNTALELLAGQFREPAFDLFDPTHGRRREANMPVGATGKPGFDLQRFMRGVIVEDEMHVQALRLLSVDPLQEVKELRGSMAPVALSNDGAVATSSAANRDVVP